MTKRPLTKTLLLTHSASHLDLNSWQTYLGQYAEDFKRLIGQRAQVVRLLSPKSDDHQSKEGRSSCQVVQEFPPLLRFHLINSSPSPRHLTVDNH